MSRLRLAGSAGFRFALLHTLLFVVSVVIIGLVAQYALTKALEGQARERIAAEATLLLGQYDRQGVKALRDSVEARVSPREQRLRLGLFGPAGRLLAGTEDLANMANAPDGLIERRSESGGEDAADRILVGAWPVPDGTRLVVADDLGSIEDIQQGVWNAVAAALAMAMILGLGVGALLSRSILGRLDAMTRTAEAIIAGDLGHRVPLTGSRDEFDRLSTTLNRMLDKIATLLETLRQVTNDVAHDLRTPLTRLRQSLEATRHSVSTVEDYDAAIDRAIAETEGLLDTFSALLRIGEIEAGEQKAGLKRMDLTETLRTVAEAYLPAVEDGGRTLVTALDTSVSVSGDRELLVQLFANLIENAVTHTGPGTRILVGVEVEEQDARVTVSDNGPGIPAEERSKVLNRFYRLERSRTTPGSGLGLTLVAVIAELHAVRFTIEDNRPGMRAVLIFRRIPTSLEA